MSTAGGLDAAPLPRAQFLIEEFVQRLFLPLPPKPQRLTRFQVAHHRQEFLFSSQMDFVRSHLS